MDLKELYQKRAHDFAEQSQALHEKYIRFSFLRLVLFVIGMGMMLFLGTTFSWWLGIGFLIGFLVSFAYFVKWHQKIQDSHFHHAHLATVNEKEERCLEHDFSMFDAGNEFVNTSHAYSVDLDLFGAHSFFQYLNRTTTAIGKKRLAEYLSVPAATAEIALRHEAVAELREKLDWRQHFQAYGLSTEDDLAHIKALRIWLDEPDLVRNNTGLTWALALVPIWMILGFLAVWFYFPWQAGILVVLVPGLILRRTIEQVNKIHLQTTHADKILSFYAHLIHHIEGEKDFSAEKLKNLRTSFFAQDRPASTIIRRLSYIISQLNVRYNAFAIILNLFMLWDLFWVRKLEIWKAAQRERLGVWFEALQEFEALVSFANLHYNNPTWTFPEIGENALFQAEALGHPLIHQDKRVTNEIDIPTQAHIKLVTGSNMAGKSTFLRTVGLNIVLAMSGAPVCARRMALPPLKVYTSMRTQDALHESTSSFYAELKRLKFIIEAVEENTPQDSGVFFLLDEILKGTNSRDQHTGSKALIRQLIKNKGAGIIATHDLELGNLAAEADGAIENLCIEVEVQGGELFFDYKLKKGVSQSFNATQLMKSMGIRIEE